MFGARHLVASAGFAHEFVAGCQNDDAEEGYNEAKGRGNMPLAKDDAKVACVPSEQHLWGKDRTSEVDSFFGERGMPYIHFAHRSMRRHFHASVTHMIMAFHGPECRCALVGDTKYTNSWACCGSLSGGKCWGK